MMLKLPSIFLLLLGTTIAQKLTEILRSQSTLSKWAGLVRTHWDELDALDNVTVLAPNNDAVTAFFNTPQIAGCPSTDADVLEALMNYHIIDQIEIDRFAAAYYTLLVNHAYSASQSNATILFVDYDLRSIRSSSGQIAQYIGEPIKFEGGFVQITDRVLHLPTDTLSTLLELNLTAAAAAYFNANLGTELDAPNIGLWAPNNDAFVKIGSVMQNITSDRAIPLMKYHIYDGSQFAHSSLNNKIVTLSGENTTFVVEPDQSAYVNNAYNAVPAVFRSKTAHIYVIDQVLNPANATAPYNTTAWSNSYAVSNLQNVTFLSLPPSAWPVATLCKNPFAPNSHRRVAVIIGCVVGGFVGICLAIGLAWLFRRRLRRDTVSDMDLKAELQGDNKAPVEVDRHGDKRLTELVTEEKYELPSPGPSVEIVGKSLPAEMGVETPSELPSYNEVTKTIAELEAKPRPQLEAIAPEPSEEAVESLSQEAEPCDQEAKLVHIEGEKPCGRESGTK